MTLAELKAKEQDKYERMWKHEEYHRGSPGYNCVPDFVKFLALLERDWRDADVLDAGSGPGLASQQMMDIGVKPTLLDLCDVRDPNVLDLPFHQQALWEPLDRVYDHIFCCDVMEHIPPEAVNEVLENLEKHCGKTAYFQIATVPDNCGQLEDEVLHLTVQKPEWWLSKMAKHWDILFSIAGTNNVTLYLKKRNT